MTLPGPGRLIRTVRPLRARQAAAQLRHMLSRPRSAAAWEGPVPALAARRSAVPFLPAPPHADVRADATGQTATGVELIRCGVGWEGAIDWEPADASPLWSYHLHQHDYLRAPGLSPRLRDSVILDWIARHRSGIGWDPHPTSLRLLTWGRLLLGDGALSLDEEAAERVRRSLAEQAQWLAGSLEVRLQANHLLSNLLGVVFAGLLLEGREAEGWIRYERALRRELGEQIPSDGLHYERSPMYHALLLENILDLLNLARAVPQRAPRELLETLASTASRMTEALRVVTHPDGDIALFGDAAHRVSQPPHRLHGYARSLGIEAEEGPAADERSSADAALRDGGYVRLEAGFFCLIASVGGPSPAYQPGHAHCDALAFELSVAGRRVVTDTGVFEYVPGPRRALARTVRSHATLEIGGAEQAELWSAFRIGGRPVVTLTAFEPGCAEGTCRGFATRRTLHRRAFEVSANGVAVRDTLEGRGLPVRFPLPLAPGLEPRLTAGSAPRAAIDLGPDGTLEIALPASLDWRVDRSPYFPEFGIEIDRACLVGEGRLDDEATLRVTRS